MKKLLLTTALVSVPFLFTASAHAATYYVAQNGGSDSNSCSSAQSASGAKQTINAGLGCLSAGDTLSVKIATYTEEIDNPPGGTASSRVTIVGEGYPNKMVTIRPNGGAVWVFHFASAASSYITLDNLILDASNVSGDAVKITYSGPDPSNMSTHIRIQDGFVARTFLENNIPLSPCRYATT